jgi:4-hydroxy-tetrahydrodipicolinate synthase
VIAGTIPALITPFSDHGAEVDFDLLDRHVAWLYERGVRCVSPLGTTGEGPSLSVAERKRMLERLSAHPSGMALLAATGCTALPETIELSRFALERRAAALLVAPPSFYPATTTGTTAYFVSLFDALPPAARVFLYHIPSHTDVPIEDETLQALADRYGEMLAGTKDSGGDVEHAIGWTRAFPQLTILNGSDAAVARAYEAGLRGTITLLANVFPEELNGIRAGEDVERRQRFLAETRALLGEFPRHAALKHLLHLVSGLPRSSVRPPLEELTEEQADLLETRFADLRSEARV